MMKVNRTYLLVILSMYVITFFAISRNFFTPYFTYDEAGQFWMAKGLNHDSDPLTSQKGLMEVIENNKYYNMDPGGFSILLHFWSYISNHHVWLRLFPFLFFIGVVLAFIYLSWMWMKDLNISLVMGFIPILTPLMLSMAFEIRAYSMESFGTVISIVALERVKRELTNKRLFLWGCIFSFFITSRYAEVIVIFIVSLYILFFIFSSGRTLKQHLLSSIFYLTPLIITLLYIYFFALSFQNMNIEPLGYLPYLSKDKSILFQPKSILFLCLLTALIILFFLRKRYSIVKQYETLLIIAISVNVLFIVLSFLGKYPWSLSGDWSNRCISLFLLMLLCIAAFIGELLKFVFKWPGILKYLLVIILLMATLYFRKERLFLRIKNYGTYFDFQKVNIDTFNHIYVDRSQSPYIRYLFEYGLLKPKKETAYRNFTFAKYHRHRPSESLETLSDFYKTQLKMNDLLKYDLLITPQLHNYGSNDKWKLIEGTSNFFVKIPYTIKYNN